jgi:hypothetical protein
MGCKERTETGKGLADAPQRLDPPPTTLDGPPALKVLQGSDSSSAEGRQPAQSAPGNSMGAALGSAIDSVVNSYVAVLAMLPAHAPGLSPEMREAFRRAKSDSSYFVREAYRLLRDIPESASRAILANGSSRARRVHLIIASSSWPLCTPWISSSGIRP